MGKKKPGKQGETLRRLRSRVMTPERFTQTKDLRKSGVKKQDVLRAIDKRSSSTCFVATRASLGLVNDEAAVDLVGLAAKCETNADDGDVDKWMDTEKILISGEARMRGKKKKAVEKNLLPGARQILDKYVKTDQEGCPLVHVQTQSRKSNTFAMPVCALYADQSKLQELGLEGTAQAVLALFQDLEDVQQFYDEDLFGPKGAKETKEREKIFRDALALSIRGKSSEYKQSVGVYTSCLVDFFNDPQEWQVDKKAKLSDDDDLGSDTAEGSDGDLGGNTQMYVAPSPVESAGDDGDDDGGAVVAGASSSAAFVPWGERAPVSVFVPFGQTVAREHAVFVPWQ